MSEDYETISLGIMGFNLCLSFAGAYIVYYHHVDYERHDVLAICLFLSAGMLNFASGLSRGYKVVSTLDAVSAVTLVLTGFVDIIAANFVLKSSHRWRRLLKLEDQSILPVLRPAADSCDYGFGGGMEQTFKVVGSNWGMVRKGGEDLGAIGDLK